MSWSEELTSSLELLALNRWDLLVDTVDELVHRGNRSLITSVNLNQDTLQSLVLVQGGISLLLSSCSSKSQELRNDEESSVLGLLGLLASLSLNLGKSLLTLLAELVGQFLLGARNVCLGTGLGLRVKLLVLLNLLLVLSQGSLKSWLLQDLGLLVWVDQLGGDKIVKGHVWVLGENVVDSGRMVLNEG